MKNFTKKNPCPFTATEKRSGKLLMEEMGISKRELQEINYISGVSYSRIIELMQLSKYEFVFKDELPGRCEPCKTGAGKISLTKFW